MPFWLSLKAKAMRSTGNSPSKTWSKKSPMPSFSEWQLSVSYFPSARSPPLPRACARRRQGFSDEDVCLTKALGLAVEREGGAARARVLLRRGAARADLERFVEARDDLKRAAQDARKIATDSNASTEARKDMRDAYDACRTELERLVKQRKALKAREKKKDQVSVRNITNHTSTNALEYEEIRISQAEAQRQNCNFGVSWILTSMLFKA